MMRSSACYLAFQFQNGTSDSPSSTQIPPPYTSQDSAAEIQCRIPQKSIVTDEHKLTCSRFDSSREVRFVMIQAYTISVLLMAFVLFWTAGDACFVYGHSYRDSRY
ncbi:hypothetical protein M758_11G059700 [Ceratodon purpureus]|uniref:Uncharacterized protein n=1 Tax=Ceratodon purpureus TaxID=3225 RepID=A0A8T0GFE8_CERPU|nr:hypothetical protein KC19_11G061700 [Ceratodon purpureus]KAG0600774.1 hypothetical protein M758_11G059700 [Ceratodon purpureus]